MCSWIFSSPTPRTTSTIMPPLAQLFLLLLIVPIYADRLSDLRSCAGGSPAVYLPSSSTYQQLKALSFKTNFAVPLAISSASTESHVIKLIRCAVRSAIRVCARAGGHSLIGHSLCRGLVIDLSNMRAVTVLPSSVAKIEPGANMGEVLWKLYQRRRWIAAGVCPSVGFAGYVLGGGHGPYEGRLGMACDAMLSLRMVNRFGKVIVANSTFNANLLWAHCGAGGGQFGIVTSFRWRTTSADPFSRAVIFRYKWPASRGGELMQKWQNYGERNGNVWFRIELNLATSDPAVFGYGACYDVRNVEECERWLNEAPFFRTPQRERVVLAYTGNAIAVHAFFGPEGGWARYPATDLNKAMLQQRGTQNGQADGRTYQSTFLKFGSTKPSRAFWQRYINFCQKPGSADSIPWIVCELNLFDNAIDRRVDNAFAFRQADIITHYIIGGGSEQHRKFAYQWMKRHFSRYAIGVYVNYAELELKDSYARNYWGNKLRRLKKVKRKHDPENFFMNPQPIPK